MSDDQTEHRGTLRFLDQDRGFGFVAPDAGPPDVFLHVSVVKECGFAPGELQPDCRVRYLMEESPRRRPRVTSIALE